MLANVDITALAIPDFVAGFVYGLTGDNNLAEIEACYQGGEVMATEIEAGIADIKIGGTDHDIQAGLQFALAATQIPTALKTCEGMTDDLNAIEQWASIFKDPASLAKKLALHYARHKSQIQADISTLESDWDTQKYFDAGKDLADLATLAIGPISSGLEDVIDCGLNDAMVADLMAGFMNWMPYSSGIDRHEYMESCFKTTAYPEFLNDMCSAANSFATKDNEQVLAGIQKVLGDLPQLKTIMEACPDAASDWALVSNWFKYWKGQGEMKVYQEAYKNFSGNYANIVADAGRISDFFGKNNYYEAGHYANSVALEVLPYPTALGESNNTCGLNQTMIADILAGFVDGFTGKNDQADLESCLTVTDAFEQDMCDVADAFATKDNQKILGAIQTILGDLSTINTMLAGCPNDQADFVPAENWFKFWKGQGEMKVYSTAYKNLSTNFAQISAQATQLNDAYNSGDYFTVGKVASEIGTEALPQQSFEEANNTCGLTTPIIADILAGFVMGFTGKDDRVDLEACFKDTDAFEQDMCDVADAFATKDNQKILAGIQTILGDLSTINTMLAGCPADQADFQPAENWFKFWKGQGEMKVYQTAYKNVANNFAEISTQASALSDAYTSGDNFSVGKNASIIALEVLPQQAAEFLQ